MNNHTTARRPLMPVAENSEVLRQRIEQSDFKQRLMATGRVANFDTKGRPRPDGAPDADKPATAKEG